MKLCKLTAFLAAAAAVSATAAFAQSTVVVVGGAPDIVFVDSNGMHHMDSNGNMMMMSGDHMMSGGAMSGGAMSGGAMSGGAMSGGAMSGGAMVGGGMMQEGAVGDWVDASDVPVVSGVVDSQDTVGQRAVVKTDYGWVAISTAAGARVLRNGSLVSWVTVPPGAVVQVPISDITDLPVPHRIRIDLKTVMMHSPMMGGSMSGGSMSGGSMSGGSMSGGTH